MRCLRRQAVDTGDQQAAGHQRPLDRILLLAGEEHLLGVVARAGVKKLASVVRPSGMGRYICVEKGFDWPSIVAAKVKSRTSPFISSIVHCSPSRC